jgi:hypothetical protein
MKVSELAATEPEAAAAAESEIEVRSACAYRCKGKGGEGCVPVCPCGSDAQVRCTLTNGWHLPAPSMPSPQDLEIQTAVLEERMANPPPPSNISEQTDGMLSELRSLKSLLGLS